MALTIQQFEQWLKAYGAAWQARDGARMASLFEDTGIYYWNPFDTPKKGRAEITAAFNIAVGKQSDIDFGARILYVEANLGAAHWSCSLTKTATGKRIHFDGIFVVQFGGNGKALSFKEWWHSDA